MPSCARLVLLSVVLLAGLARASDDEDKKKGNDELAEAVQQLNQDCGAKVTVTYDWASEAASPGKPAYQGPTYCKEVIKGLADGCTNKTAKPVLVELIKSVSCRFEPGASKKVKDGAVMTVSGTALAVSYDWTSGNLQSETYFWLMKRMLTPGPNGPVTIEARQEKADGEQQFAEGIAAFQDKCGAKIAVTYDFASEKGHTAKPAWQGYLYCKQVLEGLALACEFDKAKVGAKVKSVECRYEDGAGKKAPDGAVHTLKGSALTASYDWTSGNLENEARKWAASKLK